jgi:hypothetical protein
MMENDEEMVLLYLVSERVPGALRVAMELRYEQHSDDAWAKLMELGITGLELYRLYKDCGRDSRAVLVALGDGTALEKLRENPESRLYVKPD